ncbi:uncharacterized protein FOMMEDRAFT_167242 [Fomitiporia mediterranea MF3/22]|uniref:uncharacterized protein n=1 Tax=Fomitiporia mediterranea (strain MF3/22) TaxID=694068 RepID=UPI0004407D7F|nr:uncharacterized protein FOMMEDRAFT_167242 [Fomitiporia mediterranea MF3/22]EJD03949.1 hypothetical protein FOMMEDRAFT_167242 [Fomitiporia mediterranea MF3/22]
MSQDDAVIRPYDHDADNKLVRFMVAKSTMEPLAIANRKAILHPLTITIWVALSSVAVQLLGWWPDAQYGVWGYLRPLPAFAALFLPFIFSIDWYQRPQFDANSVETLKRPDMNDIKEYYGRSPSSGLWIYEYGNNFVGLIAVDASVDSLSEETLSSPSQRVERQGKGKERGSSGSSTGDSTIAVVRHLYVAEQYRIADAQDDLISFALERVFGTSSSVERIRIIPSPLITYLGPSLRKAGFEVIGQGDQIGVLKWSTLIFELTRGKWENPAS